LELIYVWNNINSDDSTYARHTAPPLLYCKYLCHNVCCLHCVHSTNWQHKSLKHFCYTWIYTLYTWYQPRGQNVAYTFPKKESSHIWDYIRGPMHHPYYKVCQHVSTCQYNNLLYNILLWRLWHGSLDLLIWNKIV